MSFDLEITKGLIIDDLIIFKPDSFTEKRGKIWTSYTSEKYSKIHNLVFKHDKFSISKKMCLGAYTATQKLGN